MSGIGLIKKKNTRDGTLALAFSTDNKNIVEISSDQYLNVWEIDTGSNIFGTPTEFVRQPWEDFLDLQFSPNSNYFIVTSGNLTSRLFRLSAQPNEPTNPRVAEVLRMSPEAYIFSNALSRDGKLLATGDGKGGVNVWELSSTRDAAAIDGAVKMSYTQSGRYLVSSSMDLRENTQVNGGLELVSSVRVFEPNSLKLKTECDLDGVESLAVSPKDDFIASGGQENTVRICEIATSRIVDSFDIGGEARAMTFLSTRPVLLVQNKRRDIYEIDLQSRNVKVRSDLSGGFSTYFSSDGKYVAINRGENVLLEGTTGSLLEVFEVETGRKTMSVSSDQFYPVPTLTRDGKYLAAIHNLAVSQREIIIWETTTGRELRRLPTSQASDGIQFPDSAFSFGFDSTHIAIPTGTRVQVYDLRSSDVASVDTLKKVTRVVLSRDSKYLLAVSDDQTAQIWNLPTHTQESSIEINLSLLYDVSFSPDARSIVVAVTNEYIGDERRSTESEGGGRIVLWQSQDLVDEACKRLTRNLTPAEWSEYLSAESYHKTCPDLP